MALLQELAVTQHVHDQQQQALAALHAEEKAADRAFKRDFGHIDPLVLPHLAAMYKARIRPADSPTGGGGLGGQHSTAAAAAAAAAAAQPSGCAGSASRGSVGPSPRALRGGQPAASPRAFKIGAAGQLASAGRQGPGAASQGASDSVSASAELAFTPLNLKPGHRPGSAAAAGNQAAAAAAAGSGASGSGAQHGRAGGLTAAQQKELCGPLGLPEVEVLQLSEAQMPEGLEYDLWLRFVELHAARTQLDLVVREQTAKVSGVRHLNPMPHEGGCFFPAAACCVAM